MLEANNSNTYSKSNIISKPNTSGRKVLLLLAVIFALPFTVAATLHLLDLRPTGKSYGNLIKPPKNLTFSNLLEIDGKTLPPKQWQKIWSIVMIDGAGCQANCQAQVQVVKQVHTSLGKEYKRIQRVLIVPTEIAVSDLSALKLNNPQLKIVANKDIQTLEFSQQFVDFAKNPGQIYLVDPLGNLMMSYTKEHDPKGLRSDLTRLLKNSWAG